MQRFYAVKYVSGYLFSAFLQEQSASVINKFQFNICLCCKKIMGEIWDESNG